MTDEPRMTSAPLPAASGSAKLLMILSIGLWALLILIAYQIIGLGIDAVTGSMAIGTLSARVSAFLLYLYRFMRVRENLIAQAVALFLAVQAFDVLTVFLLSGKLDLGARAFLVGFAIWLPALTVALFIRHRSSASGR
jgi:hypothetical protein